MGYPGPSGFPGARGQKGWKGEDASHNLPSMSPYLEMLTLPLPFIHFFEGKGWAFGLKLEIFQNLNFLKTSMTQQVENSTASIIYWVTVQTAAPKLLDEVNFGLCAGHMKHFIF